MWGIKIALDKKGWVTAVCWHVLDVKYSYTSNLYMTWAPIHDRGKYIFCSYSYFAVFCRWSNCFYLPVHIFQLSQYSPFYLYARLFMPHDNSEYINGCPILFTRFCQSQSAGLTIMCPFRKDDFITAWTTQQFRYVDALYYLSLVFRLFTLRFTNGCSVVTSFIL